VIADESLLLRRATRAPLFGADSNRIGRKPVHTAVAVLLIAASYPLFLVMRSGAPCAGLVRTVILAIILGVHAATVAELFPTRTRYTGLSVAYSVTASILRRRSRCTSTPSCTCRRSAR
jgi:MHS family proline/betaine transporter-like MFS transporter